MKDAVNNQEVVEIDIRELLVVFLRKWWLIGLSAILCAAIALLMTIGLVTPMYRAQISIYVSNNKSISDKDYLSSADLAAAQRLVNTYVRVTKSHRVLEKISDKLNQEYSVQQLSGAISAEQQNETEIFCIYVVHPDPQEAARIANAAAEVAPGEMSKLIEGTSATVIDYAQVPTGRYSPSYVSMTMLGGIVGVMLVLIFLTVCHLKDTRIKTEKDLTGLFPFPVLGSIPAYDQVRVEGSYGYATARETKEEAEA